MTNTNEEINKRAIQWLRERAVKWRRGGDTQFAAVMLRAAQIVEAAIVREEAGQN